MNHPIIHQLISQIAERIKSYKHITHELAYTPQQTYDSMCSILKIDMTLSSNTQEHHTIITAIKKKLQSSNNIIQQLTNMLLNLQQKIFLISVDNHQTQEESQNQNLKIQAIKKEEKKKRKEKKQKQAKSKQFVIQQEMIKIGLLNSMSIHKRQIVDNIRKIQFLKSFLQKGIGLQGHAGRGLPFSQLQVFV